MTHPEEIKGTPSVVHPTPVNRRNPYLPVQDFVSNVSRFKIIESTLREGEQFANAFFDTATKIEIAKALDDFGVDYIELTSPAASEQSRKDCEAICKLGLKAKILTHVRCTMEDARIAVETGVDGLDVVIGTSHFLREFSHGKNMEYITKSAIEVINFIKSKGLEVRFSSEDSFRSDLVDLLILYREVDRVGVNRVGIADTVGCATPRQVYDLVRTLRGVVSCDIEIHLHNDTGCAIANAYCALEAGATHIDTSVIGIGERNGITSLGGLMARMIVADREYVTKKYNLHKLKEIEDLVAESVQINTPFNNPITGFCAFTHKAGIHAKAILNNPSTYEIINPADFGLTRYVHFASRLTGWNAVKTRVGQLGLEMTDGECKIVTQKIKALADVRPIAIDDADSIIRTFHLSLRGTAASPGTVAAKASSKGGVTAEDKEAQNENQSATEEENATNTPVAEPVREAEDHLELEALVKPDEKPSITAVEALLAEVPADEAPSVQNTDISAPAPEASTAAVVSTVAVPEVPMDALTADPAEEETSLVPEKSEAKIVETLAGFEAEATSTEVLLAVVSAEEGEAKTSTFDVTEASVEGPLQSHSSGNEVLTSQGTTEPDAVEQHSKLEASPLATPVQIIVETPLAEAQVEDTKIPHIQVTVLEA